VVHRLSSGLTTGVWMGRDDAKPVAGLQGGTAPARAFHDFMVVAVAKRPVEQFDTQVPIPDWQLTAEEQVFGDAAYDPRMPGALVDENGMPLPVPGDGGIPQQQPTLRPEGSGEPSQQWLDQVLPPQQPQQPQPQQQPPQPEPEQPRSDEPADPPQQGPGAA
jgi:penicillin-binding protein 1A